MMHEDIQEKMEKSKNSVVMVSHLVVVEPDEFRNIYTLRNH